MAPLRVGAMLDAAVAPAWVAWIVNAIRAADDLVLAAADVGGAEPERPPRAYALYESLDRRLFCVEPDAFAPVDLSATLADVPRRDRELDVLLALGRARPPGAWVHRHGDRGGPPLFWELFRGDREFESVLEVVGGPVIYRSTSSTDPVSLQRNRNVAYWKGARFALRRLEDVANGRWRPHGAPARPPPAAAAAFPSSTQTLRHAATVTRRVARRKLRHAALQHQWFVGLRRRRADRLPHEDPAPWSVVLPPPDRSYTDPFVVEHGGETFLFLEVLVHARGRGELAVARVEPDGRLTGVEPILPLDHHLSYPYVFRDGGRTYMIPETGEARSVQLFAATDFPRRWERVATLLDGVNAVDATVLAHGGRYWMWVSIAAPGGRLSDETFLFSSDRLDAGWTPHPRNPVVSDARRARPAGRPFVHRGRLIRPSQNCSGRYGASVVFNEVEVLTAGDYRERPCGSLRPGWAARPNLAAHTYTFGGEWEATDGLRTFPRLLTRGAR